MFHINLHLFMNFLTGMAIGNGFSDPEHMLKYGSYLHQIGLIDVNAKKIFEDEESKGIKYIQEKKWDEAFDVRFHHYLNSMLRTENCKLDLSGQECIRDQISHL